MGVICYATIDNTTKNSQDMWKPVQPYMKILSSDITCWKIDSWLWTAKKRLKIPKKLFWRVLHKSIPVGELIISNYGGQKSSNIETADQTKYPKGLGVPVSWVFCVPDLF